MAETIFTKSADSTLDVYKPAKVLQLSFTVASAYKNWEHNDGEGDPWWSGGGSAKPYQYTLTFTVTEYTHGSHKTREHRKYNGMDVSVGDWVAGSQDGKCLQIVSITSKSTTTVVAIAEDIDRYNVFRSSTGSPIFSVPGTGVLFTLNGEGMPMIDPLPASVVSADFYPNIVSRFEYMNPAEHFPLGKTAHGFARGDVVVVTSGGVYEKATAATISRTIGVVSYVGPGPDRFKVKPQNQIIDFNPALPGSIGSFIYADTDGDLTTTDTGKIMFLKIKDAVNSVATGNIANATTTINNKMEINGVNVSLVTGTTIANAVTDITSASNTFVTATEAPVPTTATSDTSDYSYGILGGYIPFSANINTGDGNALINVTSSPSGNAQYGAGIANGTDIKTTLDALNITNLTTEVLGTGQLKLTEASGNAINIFNVQADAQASVVFAGDNSVTGLPTSTVASTGKFLRLTRTDGGAIDLEEKVGTPIADFGLTSVHNGQFPLGLYVEHGVRSAGTTVVATISARNSLSPQVGDMAYVTDAGDNEWAMFVWDGSAWVEIGNQDSAATDAQTLTYTLATPGGGFGGVETVTLGNISPGARIVDISVEVTTAYANFSGTTPIVEVGDTSDINAYMEGDESDLSTIGTYTANPNYVYPSSQNNELTLRAKITHSGATLGAGLITVTYV
jgi:hypothetical protein|tara:strand:+ start:26441 stop:28474 length:2034 start_codon:yes stop_codon:yes gene_type:complete